MDIIQYYEISFRCKNTLRYHLLLKKKLIKRRFYNVLDKVVKLHLDMLGVYLHTQYKKKTAFRKINFISLVLFEQKMFLTIFLIEC